jgi:hypothetical protein
VRDSDIDGVRIALQQTLSVSGSVFGELSREGSRREDLPNLRVRLIRSTIEFDQTIDALTGADGTFTLHAVAPLAEYDVAVDPLPPGTYVRSIRSGGRDMLSGTSRFLPDEQLRIELAAATASLDVHVTGGSTPAAGIQVVLVPAVPLRRRADRYVTGFTGETGNLQLTSIPP